MDREAEIEQLLAAGLGEAGAAGGQRGGGSAGASGGRAGGGFAARFLKTQRHEEEARLPADPEAAAGLARDVLEGMGTLVREEADGDGRMVRGVIGSGWLNMNPAVVDVRVGAGGGATVRAAAKEGPIKQRTAQKAVRRVIEALYSAAPPS